MKPKSSNAKSSAERVVKDIRRKTRRHFSAEDKIRIVLDGLRGEDAWLDELGEANTDRACVLAHDGWAQISEHWPPARKRATLAAEIVSS